MCGIFGVVNGEKYTSKPLCDYMTDATKVGVLRGNDSTGFFQVNNKDQQRHVKTPLPGAFAVDYPRVQTILNTSDTARITIGHHRAATRGSICQANSHPFLHSEEERELIGVHNGWINVWYKRDDDIDFEVDSDWAYHRIFRDGAAEAISKFNGAWAFVWHENDGLGLRICRNEQRDLHFAFVKDKNVMLVASEHEMLYWLSRRRGIAVEAMLYPEAGYIYYFNPDDVRDFTQEKIPAPKGVSGTGAAARRDFNSNDAWDNWAERRAEAEEQAKQRRDSLLALPRPSTDVIVNDAHVKELIGEGVGAMVEFLVDRKRTMEELSPNKVHGEVILNTGEVVPALMDNVDGTTRDNVLNAAPDSAMIKCRIIGATRLKIRGIMEPSAIVATPSAIHTIADTANSALAIAMSSADVEEESESLIDAATVPGPSGTRISIKDFDKLVAHGCGECTGPIEVSDATENNIEWRSNDTGIITPVHKTCIIEQRHAVSSGDN